MELERLGYTPSSREFKVYEMARLSQWLERHGLVASDAGASVDAFLASWKVDGKRAPTLKALKPLLDWFAAQSVIQAHRLVSAPHHPVDEVMDDYRRWMIRDRSLAVVTVVRYEATARRFLDSRVGGEGGVAGTDGLEGQAVTRFLLAEASRGLVSGSLQGRVAELRSLLRFLHLKGLTHSSLAESVPPIPGWKDTSVPKRLSAADVKALVDSCDRTTPTGIRDFAMLVVLARLGLRAAEVAGLELDDLNWRAAEMVVRGKARREDRLPVPADVGEASSAYLVEARPRVESRVLFLTVAAPPRPMWSTAVSQMVWRQCIRAGVPPVRAHRLRHALATELLDCGVALSEIAQVLRHRDLATTAVYAKVDHSALRQIALPWPAVSR